MSYFAPPAKAEISATPSPSNATAKAGFGKLWDMVMGLLGTTGNPEDAFDALKKIDPHGVWNIKVVPSVASSALTLAIKGNDGTDCAAANPGYAHFRHSTIGDGTVVRRKLAAALSLVVSSGSTLGHLSAIAGNIFVYLIDNAGALELAVSGSYRGQAGIYSTTAEGGAGAADSPGVLYSATARANVAGRLIAVLESTQTTAGTWAAVPSANRQAPFTPLGIIRDVGVVGGTADALTGTSFAEPAALIDGLRLRAEAASANATTTPTFNLTLGGTATGALTIVKGNGAAVSIGDIAGAGHLIELVYRASSNKWVLLNPAKAVSRGKQTISMPAGAMVARTTTGAAGPNQTETATNKNNFRSLDFDQATQQHADFLVTMPKGWDLSTLSAKFVWSATAGTAAQGVVWGIQAVALSDGDALDTAMGTAQEVTDALLATGQVHQSADTAAITVGNTPAARDLVIFRVYRKAADGADTLAATAQLIAVELTANFSAADDS